MKYPSNQNTFRKFCKVLRSPRNREYGYTLYTPASDLEFHSLELSRLNSSGLIVAARHSTLRTHSEAGAGPNWFAGLEVTVLLGRYL